MYNTVCDIFINVGRNERVGTRLTIWKIGQTEVPKIKIESVRLWYYVFLKEVIRGIESVSFYIYELRRYV